MHALQALDAGTKQWSMPDPSGEARPCSREDAAWVWDPRSFSLVLFGGWAGRWLGDTWRADVSSVVGPGYACLGISPAIGPVAGGTEVTISGLRFRWGAKERGVVSMQVLRLRGPGLHAWPSSG